MMIKKNIVFIFILLSLTALSQKDTAKYKDLKVGVVLSGGGAKGFAHIGVLKVLEEVGIRVDYIGGTSMGAIIGALYASGYSADELDSIVTFNDFDKLMQDELPRRSKSIYQKENTEKYAITLPFKNKTIGLPQAVSKGQNVLNLLSKLTEDVHDISDFSMLPIPFFCVATNLENGQAEILEKGYLPEAVRASGAFPTLLDPVEINGELLTDGGVVNNFPVDIMRKKGVDFIIGIDIQDKLHTKKELNSAPKIIMQIVNFQMYDNLEQKRADTDLYLHPDISNFTVVSFDKAKEIIEKGIEVAEKQYGVLKEIARKQNYVKVKYIRKNNKKSELIVDKVIINGNKNYTREYILGKLKLTESKPTTYKNFYEGIDNLTATGNFRNIQYKFIQSNKGLQLVIDIKEQQISTFLQFGIHYDDLYKTAGLVNFTSKHALFDNDVFSVDLILGDNIRYNIDYFIDNGFHWSYGIKTRYNKFEKSFFENAVNQNSTADTFIGKLPIKYNDFTTQLYLQTEFNRDFALRIGAEDKYVRVFYETLNDDKPLNEFIDNTNYINAFSTLLLDTYDDKNFPKKGFFLFADYRVYLLASSFNKDFEPFSQLKGKLGTAFTFGNKFTTQITSEAGVTLGTSNRVFDYFLGGNNQNFINNFSNFYGYDVADLSNSSFLKSTLILRYEVFKNNYTLFIANAARVGEDILNKGKIFENTKTGYALGYGVRSSFGPIEIKYSWSPDTGLKYWFFNVGFWF